MPIAPLPESAPPERGSYGDLRRDGFRVTRWNAGREASGRFALDQGSLLVCLNVAGSARIQAAGEKARALEAGRILVGAAGQGATMEEAEPAGSRLVALELRRTWLTRWLPEAAEDFRPVVRDFLRGSRNDAKCEVRPFTAPVAQIAADLLQPPARPAAWKSWHYAKALELGAEALLSAPDEELFCHRTKRVGRERVTRVQEILRADLENPPGLDDLGRMVGCSPFHLSRIFRRETGATISTYLRKERLARAAELLRSGSANVTEAAMTVGYSSLSHFSKAFAEAFGCCPCLYGRKASAPAPTPIPSASTARRAA